MNNVINYFKGLSTDTRTALRNATRLVEAVALLIVGSYAYYEAHHALKGWSFKTVVASSLVIGVRGAYELLCHLAEKRGANV